VFAGAVGDVRSLVLVSLAQRLHLFHVEGSLYCYRRSGFANSAGLSCVSCFELCRHVCCMCFVGPSKPSQYVAPWLEVIVGDRVRWVVVGGIFCAGVEI
jgi:hypothetical protein